MSFRATIPYVIFGVSHFLTATRAASHNPTAPSSPDVKIEIPRIQIPAPEFAGMLELRDDRTEAWENQALLDIKAQNLGARYVENMLNAQQRLRPMLHTAGYRAAVRHELPGAPVGYHCMYGQYTHLQNALHALGDTMTIIPPAANAACEQFKKQMRARYRAPEYAGAICDGRIFESDAAYDAALNKYLAARRINANTPDSVRMAAVAKFARANISADQLSPGAILIVPRFHGARDLLHAIMYVGRGVVVDGRFVPDAGGRHIYAGHNNESVGDLFVAYDLSNVFVVDTKQVARIEYGKEFDRIKSMSHGELVAYLCRNRPDVQSDQIAKMSHQELLQAVRVAYFRGPVARSSGSAYAMYDNARQKQISVARSGAMGRTI